MRLIECLRVARKVSKMFPEGCKTGNELDWMLKGNCPVCVASPIEHLSIFEYGMKYPARNTLAFGMVKINLCDYHLGQLRLLMEKENQCPNCGADMRGDNTCP